MSQTIHQNRLASFQHHPDHGLVELVWTDATADMSDADFQEQLALFSTLAQRHRARALRVGARAFQHKMSAEIGDWRDRTIIPRYNDAGVDRFAFVLAEAAALPPEQPARQGGPRYPTRFFHGRDQALAWLAEPGAEVAPRLEIAVQYQLAEDAPLDDIRAGIRRFVAAIRAGHPDIEYRSMQQLDGERRFLHVIRSSSPDALSELQAQPFFSEFAGLLRPACVEGPSATRYEAVAST